MSVSPVYDGFVLGGHAKRSRVAGNSLTSYFKDLIENKKVNCITYALVELIVLCPVIALLQPPQSYKLYHCHHH